MYSGVGHFICCRKGERNFAPLGIKAAYSIAKLQPNSSRLTNYFSSLVWWANYFYPTTAKLHPISDAIQQCLKGEEVSWRILLIVRQTELLVNCMANRAVATS